MPIVYTGGKSVALWKRHYNCWLSTHAVIEVFLESAACGDATYCLQNNCMVLYAGHTFKGTHRADPATQEHKNLKFRISVSRAPVALARVAPYEPEASAVAVDLFAMGTAAVKANTSALVALTRTCIPLAEKPLPTGHAATRSQYRQSLSMRGATAIELSFSPSCNK